MIISGLLPLTVTSQLVYSESQPSMISLRLNFKAALLESPGLKSLFSVVIPIITGILSGTFIIEITTSQGLRWLSFYQSLSFYGLLFLVVVIYFYNRAVYVHEREIKQFLDNDFCIAYMRSKCLPEAAERWKELIRNGMGGELRQAMDELKKILR